EGARRTESLRTAQERYDAEIARYRELLEAGAISQQTFNRAVQAAQMRLEAASQTTKSAGEEMSQYAVGAARSIQATFADFLFDPFDEGLAGMVRGFADAIRRMIAEAAAARMLGWLLGPQFGVTGGVLGALVHSGGTVGEAASTRTLPALARLGAPRYHPGRIAGLAPPGQWRRAGRRRADNQRDRPGRHPRPPADPRRRAGDPQHHRAQRTGGARRTSRVNHGTDLHRRFRSLRPAGTRPLRRSVARA